MLINDVAKKCNTTKKAIEYYVLQGLVSPAILENGYRDFSNEDIEVLEKITIYRKLGLSVNDIRKLLNDSTCINEITDQRTFILEYQIAQQDILDKLSQGKSIFDLKSEIDYLEHKSLIIEKLNHLFPSYLGRFISIQYAHFLNILIETDAQKEAYSNIVEFLDDVPTFDLSQELIDYMEAFTNHVSTSQIKSMIETKIEMIADPDYFLENSKELINDLLAFKNSNSYQTSPSKELSTLVKDFCSTTGYYDIFIPAMRALSPLYNKHYQDLEVANKKLLDKYPELS